MILNLKLIIWKITLLIALMQLETKKISPECSMMATRMEKDSSAVLSPIIMLPFFYI